MAGLARRESGRRGVGGHAACGRRHAAGDAGRVRHPASGTVRGGARGPDRVARGGLVIRLAARAASGLAHCCRSGPRARRRRVAAVSGPGGDWRRRGGDGRLVGRASAEPDAGPAGRSRGHRRSGCRLRFLSGGRAGSPAVPPAGAAAGSRPTGAGVRSRSRVRRATRQDTPLGGAWRWLRPGGGGGLRRGATVTGPGDRLAGTGRRAAERGQSVRPDRERAAAPGSDRRLRPGALVLSAGGAGGAGGRVDLAAGSVAGGSVPGCGGGRLRTGRAAVRPFRVCGGAVRAGASGSRDPRRAGRDSPRPLGAGLGVGRVAGGGPACRGGPRAAGRPPRRSADAAGTEPPGDL